LAKLPALKLGPMKGAGDGCSVKYSPKAAVREPKG
jgi:hypothetical protein